jgi:hypothetical protein
VFLLESGRIHVPVVLNSSLPFCSVGHCPLALAAAAWEPSSRTPAPLPFHLGHCRHGPSGLIPSPIWPIMTSSSWAHACISASNSCPNQCALNHKCGKCSGKGALCSWSHEASPFLPRPIVHVLHP